MFTTMKKNKAPGRTAARRLAGLLIGLVVCSCVTPLPMMNTLPTIPTYGPEPLKYEGANPCVFAVQESVDYNPTIYRYIAGYNQQNGRPITNEVTLAAGLLCNWTKDAIVNVGYKPHVAEGYITRADRLALNRVLLPWVNSVRQLKGREGFYVDVEIGIVVYDPEKDVVIGRSTAWGRATWIYAQNPRVMANLYKQIDAACLDALKNITTLQDFRALMCP